MPEPAAAALLVADKQRRLSKRDVIGAKEKKLPMIRHIILEKQVDEDLGGARWEAYPRWIAARLRKGPTQGRSP